MRGESLQESARRLWIAEHLDHFFHPWKDLAHPLVRYDVALKLLIYPLEEEATQE